VVAGTPLASILPPTLFQTSAWARIWKTTTQPSRATMDLLEPLKWRYATKQFDAEKSLTNEQVNQLLEATNFTATSYGLQPFKLLVLNDQAKQDSLVASSYGQAQVADASHVIIIATRTDVDADYISDYVDYMESERGLAGGAMDQFKNVMIGSIAGMSEKDRETWATKQAYIALGTLLTACAAAKIDACPMEGFVNAEYDEILGLAEMNLHAVLVIPIGFRSADDKYQSLKKIRRPLSDMVVSL